MLWKYRPDGKTWSTHVNAVISWYLLRLIDAHGGVYEITEHAGHEALDFFVQEGGTEQGTIWFPPAHVSFTSNSLMQPESERVICKVPRVLCYPLHGCWPDHSNYRIWRQRSMYIDVLLIGRWRIITWIFIFRWKKTPQSPSGWISKLCFWKACSHEMAQQEYELEHIYAKQTCAAAAASFQDFRAKSSGWP